MINENDADRIIKTVRSEMNLLSEGGCRMDVKQLDLFAKEIITEAGKRIRAAFSYDIEIETKSNANDLVTNIDREIELFFIEKIKAFDPTHRILGEEGMGEKVESLEGVVWIIDPIDGTMNFVKQHRHFMISIGVYVDGVGILGYIFDVMREELKLLGMQYLKFMKARQERCLSLCNILDRTNPGIYGKLGDL